MRDFSFEFAFITDPQIGMNSPNGLDGPDSDRSRLEALLANHNAEGLLRGAGSRLRGIQVPAGRGGDRAW